VPQILSPRFAATGAALVASAAVLFFAPAGADADRIRIRAGGRVSVRASGHVHVNAGPVRRVRVRRHHHHHVHVRPRVYWGWGIRFASPPPPPPPPCYDPCGVSVNAYYTEPAPAVEAVAPAPPPPPVPTFGIGLFAGSVNVEDNEPGGDLGLMARLRLSHHLRLEGEVSRAEHANSARVDRRAGGALLYDLAPHSKLSPFLLAGLGFAHAEMQGGAVSAEGGYGEVGVGLEWRLGRNFSLVGDLRAGAREYRMDEDDVVPLVATPASVDEEEGYTRARLGAMLYF